MRKNVNKPRNMATMLATLCFLLVSVLVRGQAMSGTYTVCASGCDFTTPKMAKDTIVAKGIAGPVVVDIKAGTYYSSLSISAPIIGASSINTVTFQGQGRNTRLFHNNLSYIVYLQSVKWLTIKDLVIDNTNEAINCNTIYMSYCSDVRVLNCEIKAVEYKSANYNFYTSNSERLEIRNNRIIGGGYALYMFGPTNIGYNKVYNNRITKAQVYGYFHNGMVSDEFIGNYVDSCNNANGVLINYTAVGAGGHRIERNIVPGSIAAIVLNWTQIGESATKTNYIVNNLFGNRDKDNIGNIQYCVYLNCRSNTALNINLKVWHNTFASATGTSATLGACFLENSSAIGVSIRNNNFWRQGTGVAFSVTRLATGIDLDYNNYWNASDTNKTIYVGASAKTMSFKDWKTYAGSIGTQGANDMSVPVVYKGATDLHYFPTVAAPIGKYIAGIDIDVDGEQRCAVNPTIGGDESRVGKNDSSLVEIKVPDTIYRGALITILNIDTIPIVGGLPKYKWYIDNELVSDSVHLVTRKLVGNTHTIKLARNTGCFDYYGSVVIQTQIPDVAPNTDFATDRSYTYEEGLVRLSDRSVSAVSGWKWEILPKYSADGADSTLNYEVVEGGLDDSGLVIKFSKAGKYKVCLQSSNAKGEGQVLCRNDYITVYPLVKIGSANSSNSIRGLLTDDGGLKNKYSGGTMVPTTSKRIVIAPDCADSIFFRFRKFDMKCDWDFVRAWEGSAELSNSKVQCNPGSQPSFGWTGNRLINCNKWCIPDTSRIFKVAKSLLIEQSVLYQSSGGEGFELEWWSTPSTMSKPKAKFDVSKNICAGSIANIINTSQGEGVTSYWSFYGDTSEYELNSDSVISKQYNATGKYTITLIAMNCAGSDTLSQEVEVNAATKPRCEFTVSNVAPQVGELVQFKTVLNSCITRVKWKITSERWNGKANFVNRTTDESVNPELKFSSTGPYTVEIWVENSEGKDSLYLKDYINVTEPYCTPVVLQLDSDIAIAKVKIDTIENSSEVGGAGYTYYAGNDKLRATLEQGGTYQFRVDRKTVKQSASRSIYIDWNGDEDFSDIGENVATEIASNEVSWSTQVLVPQDATIGQTRIRIKINKGGETSDDCSTVDVGEYEDYTVKIIKGRWAPRLEVSKPDTLYAEVFGPIIKHKVLEASDSIEGDLLSKVVMYPDSSTVTSSLVDTIEVQYGVTNSIGQSAVAKRWIIVRDTTKPIMQLRFNDTAYVEQGMLYIDSGVIVSDNYYSQDYLLGKGLSMTSNVDENKIGIYKVQYSLVDGSGNVSEPNTVVRSVEVVKKATSIEDIKKVSGEVIVYPNPNNGHFYVRTDMHSLNNVQILVLDAMGRLVKTVHDGSSGGASRNNNNIDVDMTDAAAGVYLLQVIGKNYSFVKRIVVQK